MPGYGHWTLRRAAACLRAHPERLGAAPSKSTIQRILYHHGLKPHQSRYFLHLTDPNFFPKMEHLLSLYANPTPFLFFFDECPGIQILKRIVPDQRTDEMRKRLKEFEYSRNGTMDVLAFLNHADGRVYAECRADHTTATFLGALKRHVALFPAAEHLDYVMDNLSSHCSYQACQAVAELSFVSCPPKKDLATPAQRVNWLQSGGKRISVHFTPCHGSWLNLVEIWFGILNRAVLKESFGSPELLKGACDAFVEEWNFRLAHPFRWSYNGEGLHEKAVARFTKMLSSPVELMDTRIMTKSFLLMTNLLNDYFPAVSSACWDKLAEVYISRQESIIRLCQREAGPKRKLKAEKAVGSFETALHDRLGQGSTQAAYRS